jgi:DNA (cytosine-5)-methyltransferase 1
MSNPWKIAPKLLCVDFFAGAGGTTRGLIDAGAYVIAGIDKDSSCGPTYERNNVNTTLDGRAARFVACNVFPRSKACPEGRQEELLAYLDVEIARYREICPGVPLLFAICAPCQPFTKLSHAMTDSRLSARKRDRGLLGVAAGFVDRYRPDLVLSENVSGISDPKFGGVWPAFQRRLRRIGYVTGAKVVCASEFGTPQRRRRSILMAARKDIVVPGAVDGRGRLPVPARDPAASPVSVAEAIGHLPPLSAGESHPSIPNHFASTLSELNLRRIRFALPGMSNIGMAAQELGLACHKRASARSGVASFTDAYTRMAPDRAAPTITTACNKFSNGRFGHYDMCQDRAISLREAAILQSFPDDYVFIPPEKVRATARMIGNAVPPKLAKFFAGHLVDLVAEPAARQAATS